MAVRLAGTVTGAGSRDVEVVACQVTAQTAVLLLPSSVDCAALARGQVRLGFSV